MRVVFFFLNEVINTKMLGGSLDLEASVRSSALVPNGPWTTEGETLITLIYRFFFLKPACLKPISSSLPCFGFMNLKKEHAVSDEI